MDYLEKSESWKEEQFDLVLQYMRTVLLKRKLTEAVAKTSAATNKNM